MMDALDPYTAVMTTIVGGVGIMVWSFLCQNRSIDVEKKVSTSRGKTGHSRNGTGSILVSPNGELPQERREDVQFYSTFLSRRTSFKTLERFLNQTGRWHEAEFLKDLNETRFKFSIRTRQLLAKHFDRKHVVRQGYDLHLKSESLSRLDAEIKDKDTIRDILHQFKPPTVFDPTEEEVLLSLGKAVFPNYREHIDGLQSSLAAVMRKSDIETLHTRLGEKVKELDSAIFAKMHCHPPNAHRWARNGYLMVLKSSKRSTISTGNFSIELSSPIGKEQKEDKIPNFVLVSDLDGIDPIELGDAYCEPDPHNDYTFEISGRSAKSRRRNVKLNLQAKSKDERDQWVISIHKFETCEANCKQNLALIINSIFSFSDALVSRDHERLERTAERIAHHLLVSGLGSLRAAVPICVRAVFYHAAGDLHWNDEAFRISVGWMRLLLEACIDDIKELMAIEGTTDVKRLTVGHQKSSACVIS